MFVGINESKKKKKVVMCGMYLGDMSTDPDATILVLNKSMHTFTHKPHSLILVQ